MKKNKNDINYIIPLNYRIDKEFVITKKVMVVIHLHYMDTIEEYYKYITCIPKEIDVIITVSSDKVYNKLSMDLLNDERPVTILKKANRGRDISSFLVATRKIILKYDYVCFIHDKKEPSEKAKEMTLWWKESLWENTLGSTDYIYNIIREFDMDENLGVLGQPAPLNDYLNGGYSNTWYSNFENVCNLSQSLNLKCDLDKSSPPILLGTVFWCRVKALYKLFSKEWKYEDFDEEPLARDGTLSHAIERILPFVAQDAGFHSGICRNDVYARAVWTNMEIKNREAFSYLKSICGITCVKEIRNFCREDSALETFLVAHEKIYIYGNGVVGRNCFQKLLYMNYMPDGFIVSDGLKTDKKFRGLPVYELSEINLGKNIGVIVAVGMELKPTILETLTKYAGCREIFVYEK